MPLLVTGFDGRFPTVLASALCWCLRNRSHFGGFGNVTGDEGSGADFELLLFGNCLRTPYRRSLGVGEFFSQYDLVKSTDRWPGWALCALRIYSEFRGLPATERTGSAPRRREF